MIDFLTGHPCASGCGAADKNADGAANQLSNELSKFLGKLSDGLSLRLIRRDTSGWFKAKILLTQTYQIQIDRIALLSVGIQLTTVWPRYQDKVQIQQEMASS